jgi:hypothetical protein
MITMSEPRIILMSKNSRDEIPEPGCDTADGPDSWGRLLERHRARLRKLGLNELERAELVSVGRMPGRSPDVTILDVTAANG